MAIALVVLLFLGALLAVPLAVEVSIEEGGRFRATPRWGPFRAAPDARRDRTGKKRPRAGTSGPNSARASRRKLRALLCSPDFVKSLARLGRRLILHLRPRRLRLRLRLGLGNPADTGRVWGALCPLVLCLSRLDAEELRVEPDFLRRVFDLEARAVVRVVPGVVLALVAGYLLTPAPWRAFVRYVRA